MHALRHASLIAGARLDYLVRTRAGALSRRTKFGLGLVAMAVAALAYQRGTELHGGLAGTQPGLLPLATSVTSDDRT